MKFKYNELVKIVGLPFYEGAYGHIRDCKTHWSGDVVFSVALPGSPSPLDFSADNLEKVYPVEEGSYEFKKVE